MNVDFVVLFIIFDSKDFPIVRKEDTNKYKRMRSNGGSGNKQRTSF